METLKPITVCKLYAINADSDDNLMSELQNILKEHGQHAANVVEMEEKLEAIIEKCEKEGKGKEMRARLAMIHPHRYLCPPEEMNATGSDAPVVSKKNKVSTYLTDNLVPITMLVGAALILTVIIKSN